MQHHRIVFILIWYFIALFSFTVTVNAQEPDPLAELEAWNKIKESTVAADYHAFLQKFPNGSLAARAREKMNTLGDPVWNELKKSNDPFKYRDYIQANPNSPFLDQAKARLEVLTPAAVEWEKIKITGDLAEIMRFVESNPTHPFVGDAKQLIEMELFTAVTNTESEDLLGFVVKHYSDREHARTAGERLAKLKALRRERTFTEAMEYFRSYENKPLRPWPTSPTLVWFTYEFDRSKCSVLVTQFSKEGAYTHQNRFSFDLVTYPQPRVSESYQGQFHIYANPLRQTAIYPIQTFEHKGRMSQPQTGPVQWSIWLNFFPDKARAEAFAANYRKIAELCVRPD